MLDVPSAFRSDTVRMLGIATSEASRTVSHSAAEGQIVGRGEPLTRMEEPGPGCEAAKSTPATRSPKEFWAPANTLAGTRPVMNGAELMATGRMA